MNNELWSDFAHLLIYLRTQVMMYAFDVLFAFRFSINLIESD